MKKIYFTAGPAQLFSTVARHIQESLEKDIPSISHRSDMFCKIFSDAVSGLKKLLNIPEDYHIFFVASGTEAMERIIENCVEKESFHFVNGAFAKRFFNIAKELKKNPQKVEFSDDAGFDFNKITIPTTTELICLTQNETSTGLMISPKKITALKEKYPEKLIAVDIVSSVPYVDLDYSLLDCVFFSIQKGFGLPAGLGVMIISQRALEKSLFLQQKGYNIGSYHNFPTLLKYAEKNQTHETPSVLHLYLFSKVIQDMLNISIDKIRKETEEKAKIIYDFFDNHNLFSPAVKKKEDRSKTAIVINVGERQKEVMDVLKQAGLIVGKGYGENKDTQIRIANFPAHTKEDMRKINEVIEDYQKK